MELERRWPLNHFAGVESMPLIQNILDETPVVLVDYSSVGGSFFGRNTGSNTADRMSSACAPGCGEEERTEHMAAATGVELHPAEARLSPTNS